MKFVSWIIGIKPDMKIMEVDGWYYHTSCEVSLTQKGLKSIVTNYFQP